MNTWVSFWVDVGVPLGVDFGGLEGQVVDCESLMIEQRSRGVNFGWGVKSMDSSSKTWKTI